MKTKKALSLMTSAFLAFGSMTVLPSKALSFEIPEIEDSFQTASERMQLRITDGTESSVITVSAGSDIALTVTAKSAYAVKSLENFTINFPQNFTVTGMSQNSPLFNGTVTYTPNGNKVNFSILSNGSLGSGDVATVYCHVDANCPANTYTVSWTSGTCTDAKGYTPSVTLPPKQIKVVSGGNVQTTKPVTTSTTTTTTTTQVYYNYLAGDANTDNNVNISDAVFILQCISNPDRYSISEQGRKNADVYNCGDGITATDALSIQKLEAKVIWYLPESWN